MSQAAASLLAPEHIAMVDKGVSTIVASRDAALRPSLMRAVGSRITPDGSEITVYLARSQSRQLLQDLAATGQIAVVFSEPNTHRTLQVKASGVTGRAADESDLPALQRYRESMEWEICSIGHAAALVQAMLAFQLEDLVAISFSPSAAFDQTPGPKAGRALPSDACGPR